MELFFVLELCRDRTVAYQWVQLGGADILSGMSKNLTKWNKGKMVSMAKVWFLQI